MRQSFGRWQVLLALMFLISACAVRPKPSVQPAPRAVPTDPAWPVVRPSESGLYSAQEALLDVLSGELQYIGTGRWPGVERLRACAFRNQRVLVVNAYCSLHETQAFRVEVYSPQRGRVRIYAETSGVVSSRPRADYFTFMVESSPPAAAAARLPALTLALPYEDLRRYEQQRYEAYLPGCYGGEQNDRPVGGCLGELAPEYTEWSAKHSAFLEQANQEWYMVIRKLRALATLYGTDPVD